MRLVSVASEKLSQTLALIGAIGIILMMIHIGADILSRNLFGRPIPATNEIVSRYYMVLIAFLPLAWVERRNGMVAVEVLEWALDPRLKRVSDFLVAALVCVVYAVMTWVTWQTAMSNFRSGSFVVALNYRVPVWPTYFFLPAGLALASFVTAVRAIEIVGGHAAPGTEADRT